MQPFKLNRSHIQSGTSVRSHHIIVSPGWQAEEKNMNRKKHLIFKSQDGVNVRALFHYTQPAIVARQTVRVVKFNGKKHYVHPSTGILTKLPAGGKRKVSNGTTTDNLPGLTRNIIRNPDKLKVTMKEGRPAKIIYE